MFPVSKLERLPPKTALKKAALILRGLEIELVHSKVLPPDSGLRTYLASLLAALGKRPSGEAVSAALAQARSEAVSGGPESVLRACNSLRHALLAHLGAEAAEWDMLDSATGALDAGARRVLPLRVYLEDIRSPYNVGSILRTAEAFGVERVWLSPSVPSPLHPRAQRTARGAQASVPYAVADLKTAAEAGPVFALETGGQPLQRFSFPASGTVLVGSEELGLSPEALALADQSLGRVSIGLAGAKRSLNVAVAFGILMQRWFSALA